MRVPLTLSFALGGLLAACAAPMFESPNSCEHHE